MSDFKPVVIDRDREDDIRADARAQMFSALRSAFKHRSEQGLKAKSLAEALGKDPGYVSRVLRGSTSSIDYETMFLFLEALDYSVEIAAAPSGQFSGTGFCVKPRQIIVEEGGVSGTPLPRIPGRSASGDPGSIRRPRRAIAPDRA